jgi:D-3-phosphoglycerate dehydrogenase
MSKKILVTPLFDNPDFDSEPRRNALAELAKFGTLSRHPIELTDEHAEDVIAVVAGGPQVHESFYKAAKDLRIIARWGVGFETVNVDLATQYGVIITIAPEHLDTVAEYAIAQWFATHKRLYTMNERAHGGDASLMRNFDVKGSTLGIYGLGRIGQEVAIRAKPLLGEDGRLLVYDIRPDIKELASKFGAEAVDNPMALFEESDTISLHVAGADTIVTYECLCAMKPHASLINPSRGDLVDDEAVNRAIREERLYYYVIDDPVNGPRSIHKGHPRIIATNHCAGITVESSIRLDLRTIGQAIDAINGREPAHILNPDVLDHPRVKSFLGRG